MVSKTRRIIVFHPFLFAIYSVLGVYSQNSSQVPIGWVSRPLIFLLLLAVFVFVSLRKIFNDPEYAGFVSTLFLNWIFMGHIYRFLFGWSVFWKTAIGSLFAFLLISLPFGFLVRKSLWNKLTNKRAITTFLNTASAALIILPVWTTLNVAYQSDLQIGLVKEQQARTQFLLEDQPQSPPDIYLIIVDGYGREDVLQDIYGYDNSQFINFLHEKGFYIADEATSNYPQTQLSLSSMMNLQYLNESVHELAQTSDRTALYELVQHPIIRQLLKNQGYNFVALPSATLITQIRDADTYVSLTPGNINEFETLLLSTTAMGVFVDAWGGDLPVMGYKLHSEYILFSLEKLKEIPEMPGPKFVFAHIMLPHPPFIFDHEGNFNPPVGPYIMLDGSLFPGTMEDYQKGYIEQVSFLNQKIMEAISDILVRSEKLPIIILQGDHGPGAFFDVQQLSNNACLRERFSILNAYYFPSGDYHLLYPSITPVNSFRVILNQYFGASLELVKDENYYANWSAPYLYTDITDQVGSPCRVPDDLR